MRRRAWFAVLDSRASQPLPCSCSFGRPWPGWTEGAMKCQRCWKVGPPSAKFCPECGAKLAPQAPPPAPQSPDALASWLGDLQPVLTALAGTAARLCDAKDALIYLVDSDQFRLAAKH